MADQDWIVAVFKCNQKDLRKAIPDFYGLVKELENVNSLHFLIRDRIWEKVVSSFRIMVDSEHRTIVASKVAYKLGTFLQKGKLCRQPREEESPGEICGLGS